MRTHPLNVYDSAYFSQVNESPWHFNSLMYQSRYMYIFCPQFNPGDKSSQRLFLIINYFEFTTIFRSKLPFSTAALLVVNNTKLWLKYWKQQMVKVRPYDRLIFIMRIPIPGDGLLVPQRNNTSHTFGCFLMGNHTRLKFDCPSPVDVLSHSCGSQIDV